jgi:hypothetical protein
MPVEAGKEPETVLSRQVLAPFLARARNRDRPGFPARNVAVLDHRDRKSALGKLVRGAQAGYPATQHQNGRCHVSSAKPARSRIVSRANTVTHSFPQVRPDEGSTPVHAPSIQATGAVLTGGSPGGGFLARAHVVAGSPKLVSGRRWT